MTNKQLKEHMLLLVSEFSRRKASRDISENNICQDLFEVSNAVQQALIDNNCLP